MEHVVVFVLCGRTIAEEIKVLDTYSVDVALEWVANSWRGKWNYELNLDAPCKKLVFCCHLDKVFQYAKKPEIDFHQNG